MRLTPPPLTHSNGRSPLLFSTHSCTIRRPSTQAQPSSACMRMLPLLILRGIHRHFMILHLMTSCYFVRLLPPAVLFRRDLTRMRHSSSLVSFSSGSSS